MIKTILRGAAEDQDDMTRLCLHHHHHHPPTRYHPDKVVIYTVFGLTKGPRPPYNFVIEYNLNINDHVTTISSALKDTQRVMAQLYLRSRAREVRSLHYYVHYSATLKGCAAAVAG